MDEILQRLHILSRQHELCPDCEIKRIVAVDALLDQLLAQRA